MRWLYIQYSIINEYHKHFVIVITTSLNDALEMYGRSWFFISGHSLAKESLYAIAINLTIICSTFKLINVLFVMIFFGIDFNKRPTKGLTRDQNAHCTILTQFPKSDTQLSKV